MIHCGHLFLAPDDGNGIERVRFTERALHHGGDVLFLDRPLAFYPGGDIHRGVEVLDRLNEGFCLLRIVLALYADGVRELGEFLVSLFAVRFDDVGQNDRVRISVGHAVEAAERVRDRVDVTDVRTRERHAGEQRRFLHHVPRFLILTVVIGALQIFEHKLCGFNSVFLGVARILAAYVGFDRVGERVHTGSGSDVLGKSHRKERIHDRVMRDEHGIVDGIFLVRVGVGDDGGESRLAARARRGGNGDERRKFLHDAQQPFHLGNGFVGTRHARADALCAVHGRTAAERDDRVALVISVKFEPFLDVRDRGVGDDLVVNGDVEPFRLESVDDGLRHTEAHESLIGDEQRASEALLLGKRGELGKTALSRNLFRHAPGQEVFRDVHHFLETSAIKLVQCIHCVFPPKTES